MIAHELSLYEQKILSDREFPVQVFMNRPQGKCQYFDMHWHEHIELHYVLEGETKIQLRSGDRFGAKGQPCDRKQQRAARGLFRGNRRRDARDDL